MPFIVIRLAGAPLPADRKEALARHTTALMAEVMGKRAEVTSVLVENLPAATWTIGGQPTARAAHLDAYVTQGTNSATDKAAFIAAAARMLREEVEGVPEATYVVVHEIAADAWGYDGITQEARRGVQ